MKPRQDGNQKIFIMYSFQSFVPFNPFCPFSPFCLFMKKIISICLLVFFVGANFSFAYNNCEPRPECENPLYTWQKIDYWVGWWPKTCTPTCKKDTQKCDTTQGKCLAKTQAEMDLEQCWNQKVYDPKTGTCVVWDTKWNWSSTSVMGITCNPDQLVNGQCKLNIYDTLGIRKSIKNSEDPTSVGLFVQDVVLSATMFIGTLVTVALVVSGLMYIFAAGSGKDPANAKKGMIGSLVGLLIVVSSYVIIRLVQYIAKGF